MQTLPHDATKNQMVVKIIDFIMFLLDGNQSYLRELESDQWRELIGGKSNEFADIDMQNEMKWDSFWNFEKSSKTEKI